MVHQREWSIRRGTPDDRPVLERMIYEALYWQPDAEREPFEFVISHPEIARYVDNWGRHGDGAVVAVRDADGLAIGAAWYRLFPPDAPGYGFVSTDIPELSIAVANSYRDGGVGRALMVELCDLARLEGFRQLSLSVALANDRAMHIYSALGFRPVDGDDHSHTMLLDLGSDR